MFLAGLPPTVFFLSPPLAFIDMLYLKFVDGISTIQTPLPILICDAHSCRRDEHHDGADRRDPGAYLFRIRGAFPPTTSANA